MAGSTIINEFDIAARPAEATGAPADESGRETPSEMPVAAPGSRVQEIERLLRWHTERRLRTWAH